MKMTNRPNFVPRDRHHKSDRRLPIKLSVSALVALVASFSFAGAIESTAADEVDELIAKLDDEDVSNRVVAAKELARFGPKAAPAVDRLIALLRGREYDERGVAAWITYSQTLGDIGEPAVEPLISVLDTVDLQIFRGACGALRTIGEPALPALPQLLEMLKQTDEDRAWAIMYVVEGFGANSVDAIGTIEGYLDHANFRLQCIACRALAAIGPDSQVTAPKLVELLATGNTSVKGNAALTLGAIGPVEGLDTVTPLMEMFTQFHDSLRDRSLTGVGLLGTDASQAADKLRELLADSTYRNRPRAAWALWRVTGESDESIRHLIEMTGNVETNLAALQRLGDMGPAAAAAVPELIKLAREGDEDVRFESVAALGEIGPAAADALPVLRELLDSDDEFLVRAIRAAIEKIGT